MSLLLDTHVLLWWLDGSRLSSAVIERIADPGELVAVTAASIWEAGIKAAVGKLDTPEASEPPLDEGFEPLAISSTMPSGPVPSHPITGIPSTDAHRPGTR